MNVSDNSSIINNLSNDEKLLLKRLIAIKNEKATVTELEDKDMPSVAINRAALGLESKRLITIKESLKKRIIITKEGKSLKKSVPEREVGEKIVSSGCKVVFLDDLGIDKRVVGIAMGWLRKREWAIVSKEDGKIKVSLTEKGIKELSSPSWIQEILSKVEKECVYLDEGISSEQYSILKGRKAVDIREEKERYLELEVRGREIAPEELLVHKKISQLTAELLRNNKWRDCEFKRFDVSLPVKRIYPGKKQPYLAFLDDLRSTLVALGFQEMRGPLIETEFWNFDALFQPQNHPARDWTDTYRLIHPKKGHLIDEGVVQAVKAAHESSWKYMWGPEKARNLMPRAHGTCLSARQLQMGIEVPGKYFSIARCFRPDVLDKTHLIEFNQIEGIICDPSLNFKNLLGVLKQFAIEIAGAKDVRFYPDYYPFTEPSVQMSAKHPELGWVEFGGAGIFRKELTEPLDVSIPVIAWGLGVDRLAMFKLEIDDIRFLFSDDIVWLRDEAMI